MNQERTPSYRTGDPHLDDAIAALVEQSDSSDDHDVLFELVVTALRLGREGVNRADLKLVNSALKELRHSMGVFAPYRDIRKLAVFGSARTTRHDPNYDATVALGAAIAAQGWMVISGAGPGIMTAAVEGAGAENSFGVGITLPFEEKAAETIADDPKLMSFKYFFTRKLTFMKESHGFRSCPADSERSMKVSSCSPCSRQARRALPRLYSSTHQAVTTGWVGTSS